MSKRVKFWARLLLGVLVTAVVVAGIFLMANDAPEDKVNGMLPITTPNGPRTALQAVTFVTLELPTPAPNPPPSPETTPAKL